MDPNPSSFLPLFFVLHNSTNILSFTCIYHLSLSKLPPTSDNIEVRIHPRVYCLTYFCVLNSFQHSPCINSNAFLRFHACKLHGLVYIVQKCMLRLRYSTYISLRESQNWCLEVWSTSFWVVLGIHLSHSIHFEVFFVINGRFSSYTPNSCSVLVPVTHIWTLNNLNIYK